MEKHIQSIAAKARRSSFTLFKSIKSHNTNILIQLFSTFVRPLVEFSSSVFNPYYIKDIDAIEKVQKQFLELVYKRCNFGREPPPYNKLLELYKLESLECRRLKTDLTLFHKYMIGQISLPNQSAFKIVKTKTRGEIYKIQTTTAISTIRFESFFVRVSRIYAKLPIHIRKLSTGEFVNNIGVYISSFLNQRY